MNTSPSLRKTFESGLLFFSGTDDNRMLLQIFTDFDVAKRELDSMFGKSRALLGPLDTDPDGTQGRGRQWMIAGEKAFEEAFTRFFRHYKNPDEVRNKPIISKLVLLPFHLDAPFVPNDLGDRHG